MLSPSTDILLSSTGKEVPHTLRGWQCGSVAQIPIRFGKQDMAGEAYAFVKDGGNSKNSSLIWENGQIRKASTDGQTMMGITNQPIADGQPQLNKEATKPV